jgi:hypothetical protein
LPEAGTVVSTLALVPQVVETVAPRPVIAAGGIADARGVVAVLALGTQAAMSRRRLLARSKSWAHPHYKRRLLEVDERGWSGPFYSAAASNSVNGLIYSTEGGRQPDQIEKTAVFTSTKMRRRGDDPLHLWLVQPDLGPGLQLRLRHLHADDRRQPVPEVLADGRDVLELVPE